MVLNGLLIHSPEDGPLIKGIRLLQLGLTLSGIYPKGREGKYCHRNAILGFCFNVKGTQLRAQVYDGVYSIVRLGKGQAGGLYSSNFYSTIYCSQMIATGEDDARPGKELAGDVSLHPGFQCLFFPILDDVVWIVRAQIEGQKTAKCFPSPVTGALLRR